MIGLVLWEKLSFLREHNPALQHDLMYAPDDSITYTNSKPTSLCLSLLCTLSPIVFPIIGLFVRATL
jgi:hypothetical protein